MQNTRGTERWGSGADRERAPGRHGEGRGWHCSPPGTDDPGREKREGGHREAPLGPAQQPRPPSVGVSEGMEGAHGTQMGMGAGQDN